MTMVRGFPRARLRRLLIALLLGSVVGLIPGYANVVRATSVDTIFMLPDADCSTMLSTGVLLLASGTQFPSGTIGVCAIVLTDASSSDVVGVTIYNSAGALVSQSSAPTGRIDFGGGIGNLIFSGLSYQGANGGAWPDDSYRTEVSLNGTAGGSTTWTVGTGTPPAVVTATLMPSTSTPVPPTTTPTQTSTPIPPSATSTATSTPSPTVTPTQTSTRVPPTITSTRTPQPTATPTRAPRPPAVALRPLTNPRELNPLANPLGIGTVAPGFNLATVSGKHYRLSALRGHPVLLEFVAIWCPHCQIEAAVLAHLERQYGPRGLRVLDILASPYGKDYKTTGDTSPATSGDVSWFAMTFHVRHPILIDPHFAVVNRYGVNVYPTIYVLDAKGIIRFSALGERDYKALAAAVQGAGAH